MVSIETVPDTAIYQIYVEKAALQLKRIACVQT